MKGKVAFLVYHKQANLTTWFNCPAKLWVQNGYNVDVLAPQSKMHERFGFNEINGKVFYLCNGEKKFRTQIISYISHALSICRKNRYDYLLGFGQVGMIVAGIVSMILKRPFLFQSLELELANTMSRKVLKWFEQVFNKRALLTIIQDDKRAELLSSENKIPIEKILIVPNSNIGKADGNKSDYLRNMLGIESRRMIVLYSGSLSDETMSAEIIRSVKFWPEEFTLVMRGWGNQNYKDRLVEMSRGLEKKIFFSFDLVSYEEVELIFRSADIGLALYNYNSSNSNIIHVGQSAGKVFHYLKYGIPCIAADLPGLRELVCDNECGVCIDDIRLMDKAMGKIGSNYEFYKKNSLNAFDKYEFSGHYQKVIDYIRGK